MGWVDALVPIVCDDSSRRLPVHVRSTELKRRIASRGAQTLDERDSSGGMNSKAAETDPVLPPPDPAPPSERALKEAVADAMLVVQSSPTPVAKKDVKLVPWREPAPLSL